MATASKAVADSRANLPFVYRQYSAEQLKQALQQAMGDASKATFAGGEVTYRRAKDGTGLDAKRLAADHPEIAAQYTVIRPGARRFVLSRPTD